MFTSSALLLLFLFAMCQGKPALVLIIIIDRRIFVKGIGASDKSCEMGALAGVGGAAQVAFYTLGEPHPNPISRTFASRGSSYSHSEALDLLLQSHTEKLYKKKPYCLFADGGFHNFDSES